MMGKGIILRALEGTVLTPQLRSRLEELLPGFTLEFYTEKPDYQRSIRRRIDSLHKAFLYLLESYPPNKPSPVSIDTLKKYAEIQKNKCNLSKGSLTELHKELESFNAALVGMITHLWQWPQGKEVEAAGECLNEAEQYAIMIEGRPDLATLIEKNHGDKKEYILQLDESISPMYKELRDELNLIKELGYPKTPIWFQALEHYQQIYLCTPKDTSASQGIAYLIKALKSAKDSATNFSSDMDRIAKNNLPLPQWYEKLDWSLKRVVWALSLSPNTTVHKIPIENQLEQFYKSLLRLDKPEFQEPIQNLSKVSEWYRSLSAMQQSFLEYALSHCETVDEAMSYLSSRHRTIPAPANFAHHSLYKINEEGVVRRLGNKRVRSSHVASRDVLECSEAIKRRHCESNFAKVMENARPDQFRLMQTLISPVDINNWIPEFVTDLLSEVLPEMPPDLQLYEKSRQTVERSNFKDLTFQHNHPFNIARLLLYTQAKDPDSLRLIRAAEEYYKKERDESLFQLITNYRNTLDSPMGSATYLDYNGRELFLSSLEQVIILKIDGYSYGSCVSGKDRKAVELTHTDAMLDYFDEYKRWPKFNDGDKDRANFVKLVANLYCSRHAHEHAGQNAPGSEGIKSPTWYFPKDIADEINKRIGSEHGLKNEDRLASDNEVKNIDKKMRSKVLTEYELKCALLVNELGEEECTRLYDALGPLINEKKCFRKSPNKWLGMFTDPKSEGSTATGISDIQSLLQDQTAGTTNIARCQAIFHIILTRPAHDKTRTAATNSVYDRIRELFTLVNLPLNQRIDNAVNEWESLFQSAKDSPPRQTVCY